MGEKHQKPDVNQKNKTNKPEVQLEDKKSVENSKESSLNTPKIVSVLLVLGFIASLVASYGVQYYRDTYVIPPQKEQTFPFLSRRDISSKNFRSVGSIDGEIIRLSQISKQSENDIIFRISAAEKTVPLNDLIFYEYNYLDVYGGGKFSFKYDQFTMSIDYIIHSENSSVTVRLSTLESPSKNNLDIHLSVEYGNEENVLLPFSSTAMTYHSFPNNNSEVYSSEKDVDNQIAALQEKWASKFETVYSLEKLKMPKAYQNLAGSAFSFLVNNFKQNKTIQLFGSYNKNFTRTEKFSYLESAHIPIETLDEQVFPLMVMATYEFDDTLEVLNSWINTVNELGYIGNVVENGGIVLGKIQVPLLFQLVKQLIIVSENPEQLKPLIENLEYIADQTWKNSVGKEGLVNVKWLGHSRGIFQLESATPQKSSSFELLCLLGDMSRVMNTLFEAVKIKDSKWAGRFEEFEVAKKLYWNSEAKQFGDLEEGKFKGSRSAHVPLMLSLLSEKSPEMSQLLSNIQSDKLYTTTGLQLSETEGTSVSTNFLLLQSLKRYSGLSGPSQELTHQMYSVLKNNLIAAIARSNRLEKSFYGRFDKDMKPLGSKGSLEGTLVLPIMSDVLSS